MDTHCFPDSQHDCLSRHLLLLTRIQGMLQPWLGLGTESTLVKVLGSNGNDPNARLWAKKNKKQL